MQENTESVEPKYVAAHKEFMREHEVVTTFAYKHEGGDSLKECKKFCDEVNAKGFNYRPYPAETYFDAA